MSPDPLLAGLRVSLVIHMFDRGGSGRVAAYLARGFAELGMIVDIIVFARGGEVETIATAIAGEKVTIRYLGGLSGARPWDLARGLPALAARLRRERPDIVVACANNVALVSALAFRRAGLRGARLFLKTTNPIATSRHVGVARTIRRASYRFLFRWACSVWTLSAEESADLRAAFPGFAALFRDVANPYVTPAMFALPCAASAGASDRAAALPGAARSPAPATVITVARLTTQKRLDRLIAAFAHVGYPGARLLILGEGEERAALARQIAALGLEDRVAMPGYVADVAAALHAARLFVLPSDYEGLPAVVLEAMATNCPVLSTDCFPAARALVGAAEGCAIIEHTDPPGLAALIDRHLAMPRPAGLRAIAERFSIEGGIASHAEAIRSALQA